jgi:hypothetical protein
MRKIALTLATAAGIVGAVSSSSNQAEAAILNASAAIRQATEDTSLAQPANYVCRWSYWGRRCWLRPGYDYDDDYGYRRPYYGSYGYHRRHCWGPWGWNGRHWGIEQRGVRRIGAARIPRRAAPLPCRSGVYSTHVPVTITSVAGNQ